MHNQACTTLCLKNKNFRNNFYKIKFKYVKKDIFIAKKLILKREKFSFFMTMSIDISTKLGKIEKDTFFKNKKIENILDHPVV